MKNILKIVILALAVLTTIIFINSNQSNKVEKPPVVIEDQEDEIIEEKIEEITLVSVGDIMYHYYQILKKSNHPSGYDYYDNLRWIKPYFKEADITIGNYETTTTTSRPYDSYPQFNTPSESLDALKDAGFDILSTINNHTLDSKYQGVIDTFNEIKKRGIQPLGTRVEKSQPSLINIERKGIKLGFLGYTYGYNGLDGYLNAEQHTYMVSTINEEKIEKEIKESVAANNDFTVVMIHWGNEYQIKPTQYQRDLAKKMADWGADIILGGHPHVVQEKEMIDNTFVIYSMGNFISDQRLETLNNVDTERGLMLRFTLEKNFTTNQAKIKTIEYLPTWVNKYYRNNNYFYETFVAKDYLDEKIDPYVEEAVIPRIESAHFKTLDRVNGLD